MHTIRALFHLIIAIALLLTITGCSHAPEEVELNRAEAVIEQHPDSALAILQAIDGSALKGELRARHALLLSQALDKNYIDIADDSIIAPAYDYYTAHPEYRHYLIMANYYRSVVATNSNDIPSAITTAMIADTLAIQENNSHYRGLANSIIALSYGAIFDFVNEKKYTEKALHFFQQSGDSLRSSILLRRLSACYLQLDSPQIALNIIKNQECTAANVYKGFCLLELNRVTEYYELADAHPEIVSCVKLNCRLARALIVQNKIDQAATILDSAYCKAKNYEDSASCMAAKYELLYASGHWKEAVDLLIKANNIEHSLLVKTMSESDPKAKSSAETYLYQIERSASLKHRNHLQLIITILGGLTLLVIISVLLWRIKIKKELMEIERNLHRISQERDKAASNLSTLTLENTKMLTEVKALKEHCWALEKQTRTVTENDAEIVLNLKKTVLALCSEYEKTSSKDDEAIKKLSSQIRELLTPATLVACENFLNVTKEDIVISIKRNGISNKDLEIFILSSIGFTNSQISLLTGASYKSVASRKSRVFARFQNQ